MKKLFILMLSVLSICCFLMAGCMGGNSKTKLTSSYFSTSSDGTLTCAVSNATESLELGDKFSIDSEASYVISYDENAENLVTDNVLTLEEGYNYCYVTVTHEKSSKTYKISVYRNKLFNVSFNVNGYTFPDQKVEEGKKAIEPTTSDWSKVVDWDFDFNSTISGNTAISGTLKEIPSVKESKDYYSIFTRIDDEVVKQDFEFDVDTNVVKVGIEDEIISSDLYSYDDGLALLTIKSDAFTSLGPDKTIKVLTTDTYYEINVLVATFAITDASDLNRENPESLSFIQQAGGASKPTKDDECPCGGGKQHLGELECNHWDGYFILARDIDFNNRNVLSFTYAYNKYGGSATYGFAGVLDGRGHAMKNILMDNINKQQAGWFTLFGNLEKTAVIKNIRFVNFNAKGLHFEGFFSRNVYGTLENVYIESTLNYTGAYGILGKDAGSGFTMRDCTFVLKTGERVLTATSLLEGMTNARVSNSFLITDYAKPTNSSLITSSVSPVTPSGDGTTYTLSVDKKPVKVLRDGSDITKNLVITSNSIKFPERTWNTTSTFVIIWEDNAKLVNFN